MNRRQLYIRTAKAAFVAAVAGTMSSGKAMAQAVSATASKVGGMIRGKLGSASATISIDGKQLPPGPISFGGVIKDTMAGSTPWWPPRVVPPDGAPNILLIMTDDQGYGVSSTFGGVIPTPALDRVAKAGLRYNQFHSCALCSPTRAALLTGRNHHEVGFGVVGDLSTGFPGYDSYIGRDHATVGRILRDHGYATSWYGKNHNTPFFQAGAVGPFDQWPSGMGFQYFYGFMGGMTNQWTPYLFRDHTQIYPWLDQPDYNLTTAMADEAIGHLRTVNATAPDQPFFVYYVPGGSHAPLHPTPEWINKFNGKFDAGWNQLRYEIFANQKRLGVIPPSTALTPWPDELPKWETLTADEKKLFARQAEIFAAYTAYTDHEIGRVIQEIEDQGKLDNTLIIYICGDNGTSPEGTLVGTPNQYTSFNGVPEVPIAKQMEFYDKLGTAETYPQIAVGWAWAFDTPFKWTKEVASHFGGTRQGLAISWPNRIKDVGGVRSQFHHVIDITPTILEAVGITPPLGVDGIEQKPIEGVSMVYTFDAANAKAASTHKVQYFEMFANRGIYEDGWYANTTPPHGPWIFKPLPSPETYKWELYNIAEDYSQFNDLAAKMPDKLKEMQALFDQEAQKHQVYPLSNALFVRAIAPRPSAAAGKTVFTYNGPVTGLSTIDAPSIIGKSFHIAAEIEVPADGGNGMIVTEGGRFGGFGFYILKGTPVFLYNYLDLARYRWAAPKLTPGKHTVSFDFTYAGPGLGKGGTGVLAVDGIGAAPQTVPKTIAFAMPGDESFDIGSDTRTGVCDADYSVPFVFNGRIDKLTFKLGPLQFSEAEHMEMRRAVAIAND